MGTGDIGSGSLDEPYAEIERVGRWTYSVCVKDRCSQWGPMGGAWIVRGRARAERKGRKVLARYLRQQEWSRTTWRITITG